MKEILQRLQEKRNIENAKSILESAGYKVTKKLKESRYLEGFNGCEDLMYYEGYVDTMAPDEESEEEMRKVGNMIAKYLGVSLEDVRVASQMSDFDTSESATEVLDNYNSKGSLYKSSILKYSDESGEERPFTYEKASIDGDKIVVASTFDGYADIYFSDRNK